MPQKELEIFYQKKLWNLSKKAGCMIFAQAQLCGSYEWVTAWHLTEKNNLLQSSVKSSMARNSQYLIQIFKSWENFYMQDFVVIYFNSALSSGKQKTTSNKWTNKKRTLRVLP